MIYEYLHAPIRFAQAQADCLQAGNCDTNLPKVAASYDNLQIILQIVFGVIGAIALIVIIVSAIQFIASQGDPKAVAKQRNTIVYAAVGLAIAVSAEAIVTFVLSNV